MMGKLDTQHDTSQSPGFLLDKHVADLKASGISREQALAANIRSVTDPEKIASILGWSKPARALGSCLLFAFQDSEGNVIPDYARLKPDKPRKAKKGEEKGRIIKYESPVGRPNRAYFPVGIASALPDSSVELCVVEGEKKALSGVLAGFPSIGLVGVWGWQQKRERDDDGRAVGDRKLIPDLDAVNWLNRSVAIIFDSDAVRKPEVRTAETALAELLIQRGATVRVVRLPDSIDEGGNIAKCGLDDYLVAHAPDDLRKLIDSSPPFVRSPAQTDGVMPGRLLIGGWELTESFYAARAGKTYHCAVEWSEGDEARITKRLKLANFAAKITGERVVDDGAELRREWTVEVEQFGRSSVTAAVPAERFSGLDWVAEKAGPQCVIQPGSGKRDHLRCAIQELSGDQIPSSTIYAHTGWREIAGHWVYLHGGGAIGPQGAVPSVCVSLAGSTAHYRLPPPPTGSELIGAVRASLGILAVAPEAVSMSLLAAIYRAPLGPADMGLWLAGRTGTGKSELAALAQQHFGAEMTRVRLPGNWASTDNALEGLAFAIKDALLVVDDFCPSGGRSDHDRMHRVADRLIRGAANSAGRLRMFADGKLRPPRPPRAMILGTGEDVPRGQSLAARLWTVEVEKGAVNFAKLGQCQADAANGIYAAAMAGFVRWLAPNYGTVRGGLDGERMLLRDRFRQGVSHARTPDAVANMLLGLRYFLNFAVDIGALDRNEHDKFWGRGCAAFQTVACRQGDYEQAHDPVERFIHLVRSLISSGRSHIADSDGNVPHAPPGPEFWGWEGREFRSGADQVSTNWVGRGDKIGWVQEDELLLDPDSTFAAVVELNHMQGTTFPVSQETLFRRLKERGKLIRTDKDRATCKVTLEAARRRVLVLSAGDTLGLSPEPGPTGHAGREEDLAEECDDPVIPVSESDLDEWGVTPGQAPPVPTDPAPTSRTDFSANGENRGRQAQASNSRKTASCAAAARSAPGAPDSKANHAATDCAYRAGKLFSEIDLDPLRM